MYILVLCDPQRACDGIRKQKTASRTSGSVVVAYFTLAAAAAVSAPNTVVGWFGAAIDPQPVDWYVGAQNTLAVFCGLWAEWLLVAAAMGGVLWVRKHAQ